MAKRERNKRAARKARQAERARIEEAHAVSAASSKSESKSFFKGKSASDAKKSVKATAIAKEDRKGFQKVSGYFGDVRSEMRQVTWPTAIELRNYSVAVIVMLVVLGIILWLVDTGLVAGLVRYTGLRG